MFEESKSVSRREFLKIAGIAGATIGAGAGLGGLLAACGGEETTTTTAAPATTTTAAPATTTTAAAAETTTTSAGVETGRPIKVGFVDPLTGPLAAFGVAGSYCVAKWKADDRQRPRAGRRQEPPLRDRGGRQPVRHQPGLPGHRAT